MTKKFNSSENYLLIFNDEVHNLLAIYADYKNLILEIDKKNNNPDDSSTYKIDDNTNNKLQNAVNLVRRSIEKTYLYYTSINKANTSDVMYKKIEDSYNKLSKSYIIRYTELHHYVKYLLDYLMLEITPS